jgi:hypothetical protein
LQYDSRKKVIRAAALAEREAREFEIDVVVQREDRGASLNWRARRPQRLPDLDHPTALTRSNTRQLLKGPVRRLAWAAECLEESTFTVLSNPGTSGAVVGSE